MKKYIIEIKTYIDDESFIIEYYWKLDNRFELVTTKDIKIAKIVEERYLYPTINYLKGLSFGSFEPFEQIFTAIEVK